MDVENIGSYIDPTTQKTYQVQKRTATVKFSPVDGPTTRLKGGPVDFVTACGINLNPKLDDDTVFEMIEQNGILHRQ